MLKQHERENLIYYIMQKTYNDQSFYTFNWEAEIDQHVVGTRHKGHTKKIEQQCFLTSRFTQYKILHRS